MTKAMAMELENEEISISNWKICNVLGKGSFGVVYFAVPTKPNLGNVAIKVAPFPSSPTLIKETVILQQFIGSPEIVQFIGYDFTFTDQAHCFYNMILEYAPGGTLFDIIKKQGKLKQKDIKHYLRMILKGLSCIHKKGLVHSDLKPENILLFPSDDGQIKLKLADFGLSKWCEEKREKGAAKQPRMKFRGTAKYMSPESLFGEVNPALDIWSLGCVFMDMITGEKMWNDSSNFKHGVPKLLFGSKFLYVPTELSDKGKDFLEKCFDRNHERRWTADMLLKHPYLVEEEQVVKMSFENSLPIIVGVFFILMLAYFLKIYI